MTGLELNAKRVMVLGAHPDDEIIGPGGTLHKFASAGVHTRAVIFTNGGTAANSPAEMEQMIAQRKREMAECDKALKIGRRELLQVPSQQVYDAVYGSRKVYDANAPDNELTLHHKLIKLIRDYRPDVIFTHSPDNHRDHCAIAEITPQSVFQASESILGHLGEPWDTSLLLYYSIERELDGSYSPNFVLEIGREDLEAKMAAMATQVSQTRGDYLRHHQQIIESRAKLWGAKCFGADRYAEPFHLNARTPVRISL